MFVVPSSVWLTHAFFQSNMFVDFRVESRSENVICLALSPSLLLKGLRSGTVSDSTTIKLTKARAIALHAITGLTGLTQKQSQAFLQLETFPADGGVAITQDIPVRVMLPSEFDQAEEPTLLEPTVRVEIDYPHPTPQPLSAHSTHR